MGRQVILIVAICMAIDPIATAQALEPEPKGPPILLAMCDKVGLAEAVLQQAMRSTAALLNPTGANTRWIRTRNWSPNTTFNSDSFENCELPSTDYILIVVTAEEPKGMHIDLMGLSPRTKVDQRRAYIFYSRVRSFTAEHRPRGLVDSEIGILLGAVVAHEVGHLLLPGRKHAVSGLMRNNWGFSEAADAIAGRLGLTGDEQLAIRDYLSKVRR